MPAAAGARFITLEGGEGAGKSTQARMLADALAAAGVPVLLTREPGGAPGAEVLRGLLLGGPVAWSPEAETLLHFAARAEHITRTIRPALDAGITVVCDRFFDSTLAYQGFGQGADAGNIAALARMLNLNPNLTIVLDVSVDTALQRLAGRGGEPDRYERRGRQFLARVQQGFRQIAAAAPERCIVVPAEADPTAVHAEVLAAVRSRTRLPA